MCLKDSSKPVLLEGFDFGDSGAYGDVTITIKRAARAAWACKKKDQLVDFGDDEVVPTVMQVRRRQGTRPLLWSREWP